MPEAIRSPDNTTKYSAEVATPIKNSDEGGVFRLSFSANINMKELQRIIAKDGLGISMVETGRDIFTCSRSHGLVKDAEVNVKIRQDSLEFSTTNFLDGRRGKLEVSMMKDIRAAILGESVNQKEELIHAVGYLYAGSRPDLAKRLLQAIEPVEHSQVAEVSRRYKRVFSNAPRRPVALGIARKLIGEMLTKLENGEIRVKMDPSMVEMLKDLRDELTGYHGLVRKARTYHGILPPPRI